MLSTDVIKNLWQDQMMARHRMAETRSYYKGEQKIPELLMRRIDGRMKSVVRTNWTAYVADRHTGFLLTHPVAYSAVDGQESQGLKDYLSWYRTANLATQDLEHFRNALLYGFSVEPIGFNGQRVVSRTTWPWDWCLVLNEDMEVEIAIHRQVMLKGAWFKGARLETDKALVRVYDSKRMTRYLSSVSTVHNQEADENASGRGGSSPDYSYDLGSLELLDSKEHYLGRVPVVVYRVKEDGTPFVSSAFFTQCDVYDITRSSLSDDIKHNVDALLMLKGMDYEPLLEKDAKGVSVIEKLRAIGLLPVPAGAEAGYLHRTVDVEKFKYDLKVTRASLHIMGCVPDLDETIGGNEGTVTSISGVALKLLFHSMIEKASEFEKHFTVGLRDRLAIWNTLQGKMAQPVLPEAEIKLKRNLPFNEAEILQFLPNLKGVLSTQDQIGLLPMVDSASAAYTRLLDEKKSQQPPPPATPPDDATAAVSSPEGAPEESAA